jgi:cytochrome c biogenesis protein CcdA
MLKGLISTDAYYPEDSKSKEAQGALAGILSFAVPGVIVVGMLYVLIVFQGNIETGASDLALLLPLGYAFAAGMVASVNPCGVLMLSTYAFYQVRSEGADASASKRVSRSLLVTVLVTLGFVVIFGVVGGIITAGGQWLTDVFPYAGLLIGVAMLGLGLWLVAARRTLSITPGKKLKVGPDRGLGNSFLFGVVFAVASLSCTLPIFLVVVSTALAGTGFLGAFGPFVGYALGMGFVILLVTVGAALFQRAVARWLRALTPHIHRLSAMFLVGAGVYLIYYWVFFAGLS